MSDLLPATAKDRVRSLLVIRLGALGDVVRTLPAIEALREVLPDASMDYLTGSGPAALLRGHPALGAVIEWRPSGVLGLRRRLRAASYDLAVDFHGIAKSGACLLLSGAPLRIGYAPAFSKECSFLCATHHVAPPGVRIPRFERFLAPARALGFRGPAPAPRVPTRPEDEEEADRIAEPQRAAGRKLVVLLPGASRRGDWKRWPAAHHRLLAERLLGTGSVTVAVAGGPGEDPLVREVAATKAGDAIPLPVLPPGTLAALFRRADLVIGADTGPLHLAAAVGTRTLGIYGASDAVVNHPIGTGHVVLTDGLPPARLRPWNRAALAARTASIEPRLVYDEAARLLGLF